MSQSQRERERAYLNSKMGDEIVGARELVEIL